MVSERDTDEKKPGWWNQAPTWQKAGVIIAALALIVAALMYFRSSNASAVTPTSMTAAPTGNVGSSTDYKGAGDTWPSVNPPTHTLPVILPIPVSQTFSRTLSGPQPLQTQPTGLRAL